MKNYTKVWIDLYKTLLQALIVLCFVTPILNHALTFKLGLAVVISFIGIMAVLQKLCNRLDKIESAEKG